LWSGGANAGTSRRVPNDGKKPEPIDADLLQATLGPALSAETRAAVAAEAPSLRAAMILGGPDFMRR
jgi:hypothetical protein